MNCSVHISYVVEISLLYCVYLQTNLFSSLHFVLHSEISPTGRVISSSDSRKYSGTCKCDRVNKMRINRQKIIDKFYASLTIWNLKVHFLKYLKPFAPIAVQFCIYILSCVITKTKLLLPPFQRQMQPHIWTLILLGHIFSQQKLSTLEAGTWWHILKRKMVQLQS